MCDGLRGVLSECNRFAAPSAHMVGYDTVGSSGHTWLRRLGDSDGPFRRISAPILCGGERISCYARVKIIEVVVV